MKIIKPKAELWVQENPYEHVAKCAAVCYQSKLKEGETARKFYEALVSSGHVSMLRHESCYFIIKDVPDTEIYSMLGGYLYNPYIQFIINDDREPSYVATNGNFLLDNKFLADWLLPYKVTPKEFREHCPDLMRYTICVTSSIDITREFNRKSPNNISEESTRYCNYSKEKFGSSINIGETSGFNTRNIEEIISGERNLRAMMTQFVEHGTSTWTPEGLVAFANMVSEYAYVALTTRRIKPEFARKVLPLNTKSTAIYTYSISEWKHIINLRYYSATGKAHPDAVILAGLIKEELENLGYKFRNPNE